MSALLAIGLAGGILMFLAAGFVIWQANRILGAACKELECFEWDVQVARILFGMDAAPANRNEVCESRAADQPVSSLPH